MKQLLITVLGSAIALATERATAQQLSDFGYTTNDNAITISGYTGTNSSVTIPSTINGLPVTSIGSFAFYHYAGNLTSLNIPSGVTSIGSYAFWFCENLTSLNIPSSVTNIGANGFGGCPLLTKITLPPVSVIPSASFWGDSSLTNIMIPDTVVSIEAEAFDGCVSLENLVIPRGVAYIGVDAVSSCNSLTSITIPGSVTNIDGYSFSDCPAVTDVYMLGNAPICQSTTFYLTQATIHRLPGRTGWGEQFCLLPVKLWNPLAENLKITSNQFSFDIACVPNALFVVEACSNLFQADWVTLQTGSLVAGPLFFNDPARADYPTRFYRVRYP